MKNTLLKVSIRKQAIYLPSTSQGSVGKALNETTSVLLANAKKLGFTFSEDLLDAINQSSPKTKLEILDALKEITGVEKNWAPLVKDWGIPTGESLKDHLATFFANLFGYNKGTTLPCGHIIPENTFPLERYNGCPYCKTPFAFDEIENYGQGSKLKVLELWQEADMQKHFEALLRSKVALDATQTDSLKILLSTYDLPKGISIGMKETLMLVIDTLVTLDKAEDAGHLFSTPNDILRYLWYKQTGFLQIIKPSTIIRKKAKNHRHLRTALDKSNSAFAKAKEALKLKYSRKECRSVARWLNELNLGVEKSCEIMHPQRNMWVRFIRALRLSEYSKKKGFENLAQLLLTFHEEKYTVWQGQINRFRLRMEPNRAFSILKKRPGLFSRSLFANMLWFGPEVTLEHFREIIDQIPARLLLSLNMYAGYYFDPEASRVVKPLGGNSKRIPTNQYLEIYTEEQLKGMQVAIEDLCLDAITKRFEMAENENETIFIDPALDQIPLAIGDRSETIQDLPHTLMGTRFSIEGDTVRLFMEWGSGLPAQHLDMDLSCKVAYSNRVDFCSYSQLTVPGCQHSGDIINIPHLIGTAEYIDVNVNKLAKLGAKYVSFTCNAYSNGSLSPNMTVGWMDSKYPMRISEKTGVAYDPSCVQHQARITQNLSKGMVFGVLDIAAREIIWLEMSFGGQIVQNLDTKTVETLLAKLNSKLTIGNLLKFKAEAQNLRILDDALDADEVYDVKWAINSAEVSQLFLD